MRVKPSALLFSCFVLPFVTFGLSGCYVSTRTVHAADSEENHGAVHIHHMGGDINVPSAPHGAKLGTMGGNIRVGAVGSFAKLHTMGGDISVDDASGSVDASTMGGKITIRKVDGPVKASTMAGDITVHMVGSSGSTRDIKLSSMSGRIELTVPKDFGMDIKIKVAYTQNHEEPRIIQHLGLQESHSTEWESHYGTPRKYLYASGRVGDGRNRVVIDTINGDVVLKQE